MARVLVTDYTWADTEIERMVLARVGAEILEARTGDESELVELVADCEAILTCFKQVTPAVISAGERLKVIGRYGIGTDNIAVDVATELGIPVTNVPAYCAAEVAEHVLAMIFSLARGIHSYNQAVREGDWSLAPGLPVQRIDGSTLGIIGRGAIGKALEQKALGLGMDVVFHTRSEGVPLQELLARADFVSLNLPATPETTGLVGAEFLGSMKPTAYLINCARGALVDQAALTSALKRGEIAGAGLDVFAREHLDPADPLLSFDRRVVATPHSAFYSTESVAELARLSAGNVADVLSGRRPASVVNPQVYVGAS